MVRVWALLAGIALTSLASPALAAEERWAAACSGEGMARRCSVTAVQSYPNNRGGSSEVTVSAVRDATCTTLHIVFDAPIALDRPARVAIDGGEPQTFYTPAQLAMLAQALDNGAMPERTPPEFAGFLSQVSQGGMKGVEPGEEMITRFAAIKEPRRVGIACAPMQRLLPALVAGGTLHLEFHAEPRLATRVYHWPGLTRRTVDIPLDGLATALETAFAGR